MRLKTNRDFRWLIPTAGGGALVFLFLYTLLFEKQADPYLKSPQEISNIAPSPLPSPQPNGPPESSRARLRHKIKFIILDSVSQKPVQNATLHVFGEKGEIGRHILNRNGEITLSKANEQPSAYSLLAAGFIPLHEDWPNKNSEDPIVVYLDRAQGLTGQVLLPSGATAPSGITVVAWPLGLRIGLEDFVNSTPQKAKYRLTQTTDGGLFAFPSINSENQFSLVAGGLGFLTPNPITGDMEEPISLTIHYAYGGVIEIKEGTQQLHTNSRLYYTNDATSWFYPHQLRSYYGPAWQLHLCEIEKEEIQVALRNSNAKQSLILLAEEDFPHIDAVVFNFNVPGYVNLRRQFSLPRLVKELPSYVVELEPSTKIWGVSEVKINRELQFSLPSTLGPPSRGLIRFTPKDPQSPSFQYVISGLGPQSFKIAGIPQGIYFAYLETENKLFRAHDIYQGKTTHIGKEPTELVFEISELGAVKFQKLSESPNSASFFAAFRGSNSRQTTYFQLSSPYIVDGLPPGKYEFFVAETSTQLHQQMTSRRPPPLIVEISRGELTLANLAVD